MTPAESTQSYRPWAGQRVLLTIFAALFVAALAVGVGFGVVAVTSERGQRDARAATVIIVMWLATAYIYGVRFAYRLDLDGPKLRFRCVLRQGAMDVQDVTEIGGTARFVIVKVRARRRLTVWRGQGLSEFVDAVREHAPGVMGPERATTR